MIDSHPQLKTHVAGFSESDLARGCCRFGGGVYSGGVRGQTIRGGHQVGFITASREQQVLFGYSLDDFVPEDAKCRFVVEVVKGLDLRGLYEDYSDQGGAAYDPATMLVTWFFAYSEGVTSTRELERRCLRDTHFIFVSADLRPDHTSLSRFRKRHLEQLPGLFVQIVRLGKDRGVSEFRRICIDGTGLKANASAQKSLDSIGLEKALEQVRTDIESYLKECELADTEGGSQQETEGRLAELREQEGKYLERKRQFEERKKTLLKQNYGRHRINITDPDALSQKKVNGVRGAPGYKGQASVDADSGLIVAAEAVAAANDAGQFSVQHAKVEKTLGVDKQRKYVADAGYHSLDELEYVQDNNVDAVIADPRQDRRSGETMKGVPEGARRFTRADFAYKSDEDVYVCPAGQQLRYRNKWTDRSGRRFRVYGRKCKGCVHASRCAKAKETIAYKRICRDVREGLAETMAQKAKTQEGQRRLNERFGCSEPVFGNLKENLGFRGVRLRGVSSVKGEFLLMCLGHNVNRLFRLLVSSTPLRPHHKNAAGAILHAHPGIPTALSMQFFRRLLAISPFQVPLKSMLLAA